MKISIPSIISAVFAFGYFTPWLIDANRVWLGVYLASFFWFVFFAWLFFFSYVVAGIKGGSPASQYHTYISATIIFISYVVVLSGMFRGYMVTV